MFCTNCGHNNADGAQFCTNCGAAMEPAVIPQEAVQPEPIPQPTPQPAPQPIPQPVYQQPVYQQPVYQQPYGKPTVPGKGLGIAAMVLGIVSLAMFCAWYLAIPCAIVGLVLGCISMSKAKKAGMKSGMAVAGITCSAIALAILVIIVLIAVLAVGSLDSSYYYYGDIY